MRDMRDLSAKVECASAAFDLTQHMMNKAKDTLDAALYQAFFDLYHIRNGERIRYDGKVGKAIILRNNTKLGLYIEYDNIRGRYPILDIQNVKPIRKRT